MMTWDLLKESFTKALPNTILLIIAFSIMNGKLNKLLVKEGISNTKIEQLEASSKEHKDIYYRISMLEQRCAAHFGDAYIKEDDDEF